MRVTNKMISDQVTNNLGTNISKFMKLQNMMSTSRRINQPSDDPVGTIKDLSYRTRLTEITQFQKNIDEGSNWLASVDVALGDMTSTLTNAKEIAVALANDTYDESARKSVAREVEDYLELIIQSGNVQQGNRYLFSGHLTRTQTYSKYANGIVYNGDEGDIRVEIENNTKVTINAPGSDILTKTFTVLGGDADLNFGIDTTTPLADLNSGQGVDLVPGTFDVTDQNVNNTVTVNIAAATDINDVLNEINAQLLGGGIDNVTAQLGDHGNNIHLVATDKPDVSLDTPLANLNKGNGLGEPPHEIVIHNSDRSIEFTVDLASSVTIGDAITEINNAFAQAAIDFAEPNLNNVSIALDGGLPPTHLEVTDANGVPMGLTVSEPNAHATTAKSLGINGDIGALLVGDNLNPQPDMAITETGGGNTTAEDLGLLGTMNYDMIGEDLDPQITLTTPMSLLNNRNGYPMGEVMIAQGDSSVTLDFSNPGLATVGDLIDLINTSGLDIQATINSDGKGIQIESTVVGQSLVIEDVGTRATAHNFGIAGSPDIAGNLFYLIEALNSNDQQSINSVIDRLDDGINHLLNQRSSVGAKMIRLDTTYARLTDYNVEVTRLLSETEDADIVKLVSELAVQENVYQAAMNAAAKIIQPSLMDFMR